MTKINASPVTSTTGLDLGNRTRSAGKCPARGLRNGGTPETRPNRRARAGKPWVTLRDRAAARTQHESRVRAAASRRRLLRTHPSPHGQALTPRKRGGTFSGTHSPWPRLAARCPPTLESSLLTRGFHVVFEGCSCHLTARI